MTNNAAVTWWQQATPIGDITVVAGSAGIRAIGFDGRAPDELIGGAQPKRIASIARELDMWFRGDRQQFSVAVDLSTVHAPFARTVLETLHREVPWGETIAYGELAAIAGRPGAARAVGSTMALNPVPFVVPCHRVIAAGNRLGGYGGTNDGHAASLSIKRWLLEHEGVTSVRG